MSESSAAAEVQHDPKSPLTPKDEAVGFSKWQRLLVIVATLLLLTIFCGLVVYLGMAIHHTLLLFSLGALVAYALEPLVTLFCKPKFGKRKIGLGRTPAVLTTFVALGIAFIAGVWWLGGQAADQAKSLQRDAPMYRQRAIDAGHQLDARFLKPRGVEFSAEETLQNPPPEWKTYAEKAGQQALPFLAHTASMLAESTVVFLVALYFLIFGTDMKDRANSALPPLLLKYALTWEEDVNRILGGFVRGQFLIAIITGVLAALGLLAIGMHLWLLIGIFVIIASLIPVFGPYLAAVPAIIGALVGPTHLSPMAGAIAVIVLFVVINEVAGKVLYPKFVGQALNLHEVLVFFALCAGLEIGGLAGTLFAAPALSLGIVTIVHLYRFWQELPEESLASSVSRMPAKPAKPTFFKRLRSFSS